MRTEQMDFQAHGCQSNFTCVVDANVVIARIQQAGVVIAQVLVARVEVATIVISNIAVARVGVADVVIADVLIACVGIACIPTGDILWPLENSMSQEKILLKVMSVLCGIYYHA